MPCCGLGAIENQCCVVGVNRVGTDWQRRSLPGRQRGLRLRRHARRGSLRRRSRCHGDAGPRCPEPPPPPLSGVAGCRFLRDRPVDGRQVPVRGAARHGARRRLRGAGRKRRIIPARPSTSATASPAIRRGSPAPPSSATGRTGRRRLAKGRAEMIENVKRGMPPGMPPRGRLPVVHRRGAGSRRGFLDSLRRMSPGTGGRNPPCIGRLASFPFQSI